MVTRQQLLDLGLTRNGIEHRIERGKLYVVRRTVYAVGRPELTQLGIWMAAVLACGPAAVLSHLSAALLWRLWTGSERDIHVTVPPTRRPTQAGLAIHRRQLDPSEAMEHRRIPVTSPICTLIDIAPLVSRSALERAVNEADRLELATPEEVRSRLDQVGQRRGVAILRELLDRRTFTLTDSELERRFLPLAAGAGLPPPLTQQVVNGFRVDFFWPDLGLVVETDGLRYHRTPAEQGRDRLRDQAHTAAGLTPLRFTHEQVRYEREHVVEALRRTVRRLQVAR